MSLLVYRDAVPQRVLVGRFDFGGSGNARFFYDASYLAQAVAGGLGVSERLPLREEPYAQEDYGPFFQGLLPESEVLGALAQQYQVPRNDYLRLIEHLDCESIGALTFVSEERSPDGFEPSYAPLPEDIAESIERNPLRTVVRETSSTRLSLAGAQSKLAWFLPKGMHAQDAALSDWLVPYGSAPSTHIIKISRRGEEDIAVNELACSLLAKACGIKTADASLIPQIPGAIAVTRYDRVWIDGPAGEKLLRLHQEDFCQALGLYSHFKYQPEHTEVSYPEWCSDLIAETSDDPWADRIEFAKRLLFSYAIGNTDCHLKNYSLLYDRDWGSRRLAPLYDVTCIPLTGYSTKMPFTVGRHRELGEVDREDIESIAGSLGVGAENLSRMAREVVEGLGTRIACQSEDVADMVERILSDSSERIALLERV